LLDVPDVPALPPAVLLLVPEPVLGAGCAPGVNVGGVPGFMGVGAG
jgi:hypothetical protein